MISASHSLPSTTAPADWQCIQMQKQDESCSKLLSCKLLSGLKSWREVSHPEYYWNLIRGPNLLLINLSGYFAIDFDIGTSVFSCWGLHVKIRWHISTTEFLARWCNKLWGSFQNVLFLTYNMHEAHLVGIH